MSTKKYPKTLTVNARIPKIVPGQALWIGGLLFSEVLRERLSHRQLHLWTIRPTTVPLPGPPDTHSSAATIPRPDKARLQTSAAAGKRPNQNTLITFTIDIAADAVMPGAFRNACLLCFFFTAH